MIRYILRLILGAKSDLSSERLKKSPSISVQGHTDVVRHIPQGPSLKKQANLPTPYYKKTHRIIAIDTETTGLYAEDRIVTFAAVELVNREITGRFQYFVFNPGKKSHPKARDVHGWSDHILASQEHFSVRKDEIQNFLYDAHLVAHNFDFDRRFLNRELELLGLPQVGNQFTCTMHQARKKWPGEKAKLDHCASRLGMARKSGKHSALEDALLALNVFCGLQGFRPKMPQQTFPNTPINLRKSPEGPISISDAARYLALQIPGLGEGTATALIEAGFSNLEEIKAARDQELLAVRGLGQAKLKNIRKKLNSDV